MAFDPVSSLGTWQDRYGVPGLIVWKGYAELGGSITDGYRNGQCNYYKVLAEQPYGRCEIWLDEEMKASPDFFKTCVLWHEFCHANAYNEDLSSDNHNAHFREYRRRKPLYWIGDMLYKWISPIWSWRDRD